MKVPFMICKLTIIYRKTNHLNYKDYGKHFF